MPIINNDNIPKVVITETINDVVISSPGPQGPRGKTILNGNGIPAENLGLEGDFYYDKVTTRFYGPKPTDLTWSGASNYLLNTEIAFEYSWEMAHFNGQSGPVYTVAINHNLEFYPNVTVKTTGGDILETGIEYNNVNTLTLTMAQPFSGTAYLS
jgi:hypothetical protein